MDNRTETVRRLAAECARQIGTELATGGIDQRSAVGNIIARAIQSGIDADRAARESGLVEAHKQTLASLVAAVSLLRRGGKKAAASDKMFEAMLTDYDKAIEASRAVLSAHAPASEDGWQPIETAPHDGSPILAMVWWAADIDGDIYPEYRILEWDMLEDLGWCDQGGNPVDDSPTHWRPLPTPPSPAKREEG